jgi:hypothetical protein
MVQGMDHNSYYHELFSRDYPELCLKMKRMGATKNAAGEPADERAKSKNGKSKSGSPELED